MSHVAILYAPVNSVLAFRGISKSLCIEDQCSTLYLATWDTVVNKTDIESKVCALLRFFFLLTTKIYNYRWCYKKYKA